MSLDQHLSAFVTFSGVLIDAMTRYTRHPDAAPAEHPLGYHQVPLWLTNSEAEALADDLTSVIERYRENEPTDDRTKVAFNTILIPELG